MRKQVAWSLLVVLSLMACSTAGSTAPRPDASALAGGDPATAGREAGTTPVVRQRLRLVTLGDAYTAGSETEAANRDSWPAQLVRMFNRSQMPVQFNAYNLAEPGQTSEDVLQYQLPEVAGYQPDFVTLQVGVNDIFTIDDFDGDGIEQYRANLVAILDGLLSVLPPDRILAITTPDHELTPKGRARGPSSTDSDDVSLANRVLAEVAGERGIAVVDIAPLYATVVGDPDMIIAGGPYPSARQYTGWVEIIGRQIGRVLSSVSP